jgi:hypothetical protein
LNVFFVAVIIWVGPIKAFSETVLFGLRKAKQLSDAPNLKLEVASSVA